MPMLFSPRLPILLGAGIPESPIGIPESYIARMPVERVIPGGEASA